MVVLGLGCVQLARCVSGSAKQLKGEYQVTDTWKQLPDPGPHSFSLTADAPIRIRVGGRTWFVGRDQTANLGTVARGQPIQVRAADQPTQVKLFIER